MKNCLISLHFYVDRLINYCKYNELLGLVNEIKIDFTQTWCCGLKNASNYHAKYVKMYGWFRVLVNE